MMIGILADVHCRADALRAAVDELAAAGVDEILLAGDAHYQYRLSPDVDDLIADYGIRCVRGNHEAVLSSSAGRRAREAPHVRPGDRAFLADLPDRLTTRVDGLHLTMVHADPFSGSFDYLYAGDPRFARCDELGTDVLVLGHTHVPMVARSGRTLVINPGSLALSRDPGGHGRLTYAVLDTAEQAVFLIRDGEGWGNPVITGP